MNENTVATSDDGTYEARVVPDYDVENPRQDYDHLGIMACAHKRYNLGDNTDEAVAVRDALLSKGLTITARWLRAFHGATVVLPLGLYDHSGISMYVGAGPYFLDSQGWDSGCVGLIYTDSTSPEAERWLRGEVEEYDQYLRGEVYVVEVMHKVTWTRDDDPSQTETSWECVDSIGGVFGLEAAEEEARGMLSEFAAPCEW